jgi:hypothetical protein
VKNFAPKFVYFLAAIFLLAGCAGHVRQITVAILGVPPSDTVGPNQTFTVQGIVNHDRTTDGVTWTLVGAGTFTSTTSTLTYTAPPNVPENPTVVITATSISTPTSAATATFTIVGATLSVQITNPITTITAGGANATLNATVTNDVNNQGVSWDLFTAGTTNECSPACGTIVSSTSTSVVYMPPATVPTNASASLVATSVADTTQSATDTFTIQATSSGNLQFLNGNYAFEVSGFDDNGEANPLIIAGSFVSDGNGNITKGEIDANENLTPTTVTPVTGTYTLDSNLRGVITLNQTLPGFSSTPTISFVIDSATNNGYIVSIDQDEQAVSGVLVGQSTSVLNGVTPSGSFIFRGASDSQLDREGEVGQLTIASGGAYTGLIDRQDIEQGALDTDTAITGGFTATDAFGRGTFSLNGTADGGTGYVYYAVSSTEFFILENDNDASFMNLGVARVQNLSSLTASSVNGVGAFGIIGGDDGGEAETNVDSSVAIGQLTISGGVADVVCDLNDSGNISQCTGGDQPGVKKPVVGVKSNAVKSNVAPSPVGGTVVFDPTTGRGTITFPGGYDAGFIDSVAFYLEANGTGVLLDTTQFVMGQNDEPEALVGDWIPQTSTADVVGQVQGVGLISEDDLIAIAGELNIQGSGQTTGLFDGASVDGDPILDSAVTGTFSESDDTGRSTASLSATVFAQAGDFAVYEVSPTQFFLIGETDGGEDGGIPSDLGIFTAQTLGQANPLTKPVATIATGVTTTARPATKQRRAAHHVRPRRNAVKPTQEAAR